MDQTVLVLERSGQQRLDELIGLAYNGRPGRTPIAAICPLCGKTWRSAPWISVRRAIRHADRRHRIRLLGWQVRVFPEG